MINQSIYQDSLAERSKAVAQGAIPQGRGLEPHSCHHFKSAQPRANLRASIQSTTSMYALLMQEELVGVYYEMLVRVIDRSSIATTLLCRECSVVGT